MTLGRRIRRFREDRGWSQGAFAKKVGTTQQTVARWEAGDQPQARFRRKLADLLEISREDLDQIVSAESITRIVPPGTAITPQQEAVIEAVSNRLEEWSRRGKDPDHEELRLLRDLLAGSGLRSAR